MGALLHNRGVMVALRVGNAKPGDTRSSVLPGPSFLFPPILTGNERGDDRSAMLMLAQTQIIIPTTENKMLAGQVPLFVLGDYSELFRMGA